MARLNYKRYLILIIFSLSITHIYSQENAKKSFLLDVPEEFEIIDSTDNGESYVMSHPKFDISLVTKIYSQKNTDSKKMLGQALQKLKATYEPIDTFNWSNKNCSITTFNFTLEKENLGWAICTPLVSKDNYLVILGYSAKNTFDNNQFAILSAINSLCIDEDYYYTPGIIVSYAYPVQGQKRIELLINGTKIITSIDKGADEASQFLVDMEYNVLLLYGNSPKMVQAWQRYYRQIYRDSYGRITTVSKDIQNNLYEKCKEKNPQNIQLAYAQTLLSWVQTFDYNRNTKKGQSDFTSIPDAICGVGNDCDSRSLLMSILLNDAGIDTIMMVSGEYSHALVATNINAPGQKYNYNNQEYLIGETTAKVTWGMISSTMQDKSKFFGIEF